MRYCEIRLVETVILRELSDKIKQATRNRFKQDDTALTDAQINFYLDRWDRYASTFPVELRDITRLKFSQVEQLIDTAVARAGLKGGAKPEQPNSATRAEDTVYNQNNLEILRGALKEKCINYGKGYSWCISRSDASNMFYNYRMRKNEPVFYFVFDKDLPKTDVWHAVVIYVDNQGTYHVATSNNPGDVEMAWQQIESHQPKLRGLQNLFKPQPLTAKERDDYNKYGNPVNNATYAAWPLTGQDKYIQFNHILTPAQQAATPKELIGAYAKLSPIHITAETWRRLNPSDQRKVEQGQLAAIQKYSGAFYDIIEAGITPSEQVQLAAVSLDGYAIQYILNAKIKPSEAVQLAAVSQDGGVIQRIIEAGVIPSEAVQLAAVTENGYTILYITDAGITPSKAVKQVANKIDIFGDLFTD